MSMCRRRPQQVILAAIIAMTCQAESSATGLSGHRNRMISFDGSEVPLSGFHQPRRIRAADLDCDGADDIIVADPSATIGGNPQAGRAAVGYGNELLGLRPSGQFVHQNVVGVAGVAEAQDFFGSDITAADFDGDGCADLAIGVEGEPVNGFSRAGAVQVFPGSPIGLDLAADFMLPLSGAAPNGPSANHNKGRAVASVRRLTTASSLPMLAIGTPGHALGVASNAGGVSIRRSGGTPGDLASPVAFVDRNATSFGRVGDLAGEELASGDFNGDGFGDLAIFTRHIGGCPVFTGPFCVENRGNLIIAYGASSAANISFEEINLDSPNVAGTAQDGAFWGERLAVGDFDGDGFDDLAVGAPQMRVSSIGEAGSVTLLFGGNSGLRAAAARSRFLVSDNLGAGAGRLGDRFGDALTVGDFDADGLDDLAIGMPGRAADSVTGAGLVLIVPRAIIGGAIFADANSFRRGIDGIPGAPVAGERYGQGLAAGDFNGDGVDDLAIHVVEARNAQSQVTGAVNLVFSTAFTATSITAVSPSTGQPGQDYTVTVLARRTSALVSGVTRIRGTVQVRASDGSQCTVSPSPGTGIGSCTLTAGAPGVLTLTAEYPGAIGFRPSAATPRAYTVSAPVETIFQNGFEAP